RVFFGDRRESPVVLVGKAAVPSGERALFDRCVGPHHETLGVDRRRTAETVALLARAVRAVERERSRTELCKRDAAGRTRKALAEVLLSRIAVGRAPGRDDALLGKSQRDADRIDESTFDAGPQHEPVDEDFDRMGLRPRERYVF